MCLDLRLQVFQHWSKLINIDMNRTLIKLLWENNSNFESHYGCLVTFIRPLTKSAFFQLVESARVDQAGLLMQVAYMQVGLPSFLNMSLFYWLMSENPAWPQTEDEMIQPYFREDWLGCTGQSYQIGRLYRTVLPNRKTDFVVGGIDWDALQLIW